MKLIVKYRTSTGSDLIGSTKKRTPEVRVNERIRTPQVRLIGPDGQQIGVVPVKEALAMAYERGLDLVEVSTPANKPPVCKILDYGKYKYEQSKKKKAAKKKQHTVQLKEMRYRPKIEEHDYQFKTKKVREFLLNGFKVKVFVVFRGREMAHTEFGQKILERLQNELSDIALTEQKPKMEGRNLTAILMPK
jgi:translation initiation factor IF-3